MLTFPWIFPLAITVLLFKSLLIMLPFRSCHFQPLTECEWRAAISEAEQPAVIINSLIFRLCPFLVARIQYERMGSDVTMQCGSLDNDASVSWKVNGTDIKARHRLEGPRLLLTQVDLGHNGLYSCFQNPHGERRDTINLRIGSK